MATNEELKSFRESAQQLQALREQLADRIAAINAVAESGDMFWNVLAKLSSARAAGEDVAAARQALDELFGTASAAEHFAEHFKTVRKQLVDSLSALAYVEVDAGRLDALLEQMQRTDKESEELVDRAERVRERLRAAAT